MQALLPLLTLYRALTDLLGLHPYDLCSKDHACGFPGVHKRSVCISLRKKRADIPRSPAWSNTLSSLSRQELQAE